MTTLLIPLSPVDSLLKKSAAANIQKAPPRIKRILTKRALTAYWILGFVDGDGCFSVRQTNKNTTFRLNFVVSQNKRSVHVLHLLKEFFGCGIVRKSGGDNMEYDVGNREDLKSIIVPFFKQYPLQTKKYWDFQVFSQVLEDARATMTTMEHVNELKERMGFVLAPRTISQSVSGSPTQFFQIGWGNGRRISASRYDSPLASHPNPNLNFEWLAGFIDADGCFVVSMVKSNSMKKAESFNFKPQFILGMHKRETELAIRLQAFLGMGCFYKRKKDDFIIFQISSISDHQKFVERLVGAQRHQILLRTTKMFDFIKFRRIIQLMVEKKHQTPKGILMIQRLKTLLNN